MDDALIFAAEDDQVEVRPSQAWKVLVADDEQAVHLVTRLALGGFRFQDRPLELFSAYNEAEARDLLHSHPDMALVLLDVIMDTLTSGFDLVRFIRQDLGNRTVRIIMRTGQAGSEPEEDVLVRYDINDFKDKTELTVVKLRTTVISSLRAFSHLMTISEEQEKLQESRSYLQQILNSLPGFLATLAEGGRVEVWNQAASAWTGLRAEQAQGQALWDLHKAFVPLKDAVLECLKDRRSLESNGVPLALDPSLLVNLSLTPLAIGGRTQVILRLDDVTALREREELLQRGQRLASLQALTGGVRAEMHLALEGLERELEPWEQGDTAAEQARPVRRALSQAYAILERMETLTKREESHLIRLDFTTLVSQVLSDLMSETGPRITWTPPGGAAPVEGHAPDLMLALQQVLRNAVESLEGQGHVTVQLSEAELDSTLRLQHPEAPAARYWRLRVQDQGRGMGPEILSHVFEPYFSTKAPHRGLGLSLVHNIVDIHRGFTDIRSEPHKGTTVDLYLPLAPAGRITAGPLEGLSVLVCDDEILMRQTASAILRRLGLRVSTAGDGFSALQAFEESHPDVVILDMLMPGLNGDELFTRMRRSRPEVKVLFSSGFGKTNTIREALELQGVGYLQKPYGYEGFREALLDLLGVKDPLS